MWLDLVGIFKNLKQLAKAFKKINILFQNQMVSKVSKIFEKTLKLKNQQFFLELPKSQNTIKRKLYFKINNFQNFQTNTFNQVENIKLNNFKIC